MRGSYLSKQEVSLTSSSISRCRNKSLFCEHLLCATCFVIDDGGITKINWRTKYLLLEISLWLEYEGQI